MESSNIKSGHTDEFKQTDRICFYNRNGVCILSDCPCMKMKDKTLVCSSYKE